MNDKYRLVLSSVLMAFVEMMLIRWTGSNIYSLFFFANFILIASFLGIGIGFLRHREEKHYFSYSPLLLAAVVLFCFLYSYEYQAQLDSTTGNLNYLDKWFKGNFYPVYLTLPLVFIAVTMTMAGLADGVARTFKKFAPLMAYRLEVLGTLGGIAGFALLSYLAATPLVWGMVVAILYGLLFFSAWSEKFSLLTLMQLIAITTMLGVFYVETFKTNHIWSTYYKIHVKEYLPQNYVVNVNGLAQQVIEPVAMREKIKPFYLKPYQNMALKKTLDNVLIIGAGTGGDVAIALAQGAKHVDAVEIDAKLYGLGRKLNPNHPYQNPRVSIYIDDGRAFLQKNKHQYDLIIYALTDSLMLIPGQSSMRLENYLYTLEGMRAAAQHLRPQGIFTIYNYYRQDWLLNRLANTLTHVYNHAPCVDQFTSKDYWAKVLTVSWDNAVLNCPQRWQSSGESYETPATDNHPFIYLKDNTLTPMYVITLGFISFLSYFLLRRNQIHLSVIRSHVDLFLMGVAFLLLETKSVINYALLFGTTWMINSMVFIGILVSVYLAIEFVRFVKKISVNWLYMGLLISLLVNWVVPFSELLDFNPAMRLVLATLLTFTPIFLANLIFANRFDESEVAVNALGANLIGAVCGGLLEYSSLTLGYGNFSLIILGIYSLAFFSLRRDRVVPS